MMKLEENVMRQGFAAFFGLSLFMCSAMPGSACDEAVSAKHGEVPVEHTGEIKAGDDVSAPAPEPALEEVSKAEAVKRPEETSNVDKVAGKEEKQAASGSKASANAHFDMDALIERLKKSDAIGMFTKLALRSDAMDVVEEVKAYRKHKSRFPLNEIRARFDGLVLKVLALLDDDPALSSDISMAREDIWRSLLEVKA